MEDIPYTKTGDILIINISNTQFTITESTFRSCLKLLLEKNKACVISTFYVATSISLKTQTCALMHLFPAKVL